MVNGKRRNGRVLSPVAGRTIRRANRQVTGRLQPTLRKGERGRLLRTSQAERNLIMRRRLTSLRNNPLRARQVRSIT